MTESPPPSVNPLRILMMLFGCAIGACGLLVPSLVLMGLGVLVILLAAIAK